ncbi:hypothetical protein [Pseudomonas mosselii]|uniref:MFS transporter n=1 Tax=Pseudomonas mosselii TaxID=78327 RepID=A0ABX9AYX6_9PSED|nr:hypothetical protein [Pseudomonas mosselii]QZP24518.1 hypothetical protein K5H97_16915 [Pseudomonas mosselii]
MTEYLTLYFLNLWKITAGFCLIIFVLHMFWARKSDDSLQVALGKLVSAAGVPNGIAFVACSFYPEFIVKMEGASWAFFIAGLVLVVVTARDIAKPKRRASNPLTAD